jgi:Ca2+-binding EF-hand superfamily protein
MDQDGFLNIHKFRGFLNLLGVRMNKDELIHLFIAIDRNSDRRLAYDELLYWYATAKKDLKREATTVA